MKNVLQRLFSVSVLMTALVACLNTPPVVVPPVVDPPIDETPIKSGFGTPVGNALTQTIVAAGGSFSEATTGVTVKAFAGTVDVSAQVKVQPITNTLPDGIGMGVEISSTQPLKKPLIVRFSYDASEPDPSALRLALQADDGAWWSLSPVRVDTVNKTVSAALPDSLPTTANISSRVRPQGTLTVKSVVKYLAFYMKPKSATVKVGQSVEFVPYARVLKKFVCTENPSPPPVNPNDDELVNLCPGPVVKDYPFTNDKSGFARSWYVNAIEGGDSIVGTVKSKPVAGATYTAPAKVPNPNTVTVTFFSGDLNSVKSALASTTVTIVSEYKVVGDFTSVGYPACYLAVGIADVSDHLEFTLAETGSTVGYPYLIANIQNQISENKNFRASQYAGGTVTQNSLSEVLNASKGHAEFAGTEDTLAVSVDGGSWTGGCTLKYPDLTFNYPPGETVPSSASFEFNLNGFNNNTQTVSAADPNGYGTWKFTITRQ